MTDFEWLTEDKLVQRTVFADTVEIFANFGTEPFEDKDVVVPGRSVVARWIETGEVEVFSVAALKKRFIVSCNTKRCKLCLFAEIQSQSGRFLGILFEVKTDFIAGVVVGHLWVVAVALISRASYRRRM